MGQAEQISDIIARSQINRLRKKQEKFTMVPNSFIRSHDYSVHEKILYIILKSYCFNTNIAWPSINTIAADVPCCKNTVMSSLKSLTNKGTIEKIDGKQRSQTYKLKIGPFYQPNKLIR